MVKTKIQVAFKVVKEPITAALSTTPIQEVKKKVHEKAEEGCPFC